jgi:deoxyribose-phosphate aldolase
VLSGAAEVDMVINIGDVKNGHFDWVLEEIRLVKKVVGSRVLKVIVETCYLPEEEKIRLCGVVSEAGADYIKTSTGFGSAGAVLSDVRLFKEHIGPAVKIKAAGGVKTREDLEAFIGAGANRIGTSSAVSLLAGGGGAAGY